MHGLVSTDREAGVDKVSKRNYRYGSAVDRGNLANIGHHRLLAGFTRILTACARVLRLVLQRQLGEWVASSFVVAEASLVLSSTAEAGPGPDVVGGVGDTQHQLDKQTPDLR
ncbi:hypothetical protein [Amycolatopsis sp. FBCC-B4732]|uniref:hypothetical protein n=1 Tax=Amycolatopsis sp. FBCC-B4732 TaxID=3079339 RepID=UPI0037C0185D